MNEYVGGYTGFSTKKFNYKNVPLYLYLVASIVFFVTYIIIAKSKNILPSYLILSISLIIIICFASNIQYMATSEHPAVNFLAWLLVIGFIILNSYGMYKLNLETKPEESKQ